MGIRRVTWVIVRDFLGVIYGAEKENCLMVLRNID
jgi:hypothetical protein